MLFNIDKLSPRLKNRIATRIEKGGLTVSGYGHANCLRHLLAQQQIDTVIDVGANIGQYGNWLRSTVRYSGRIVSVEPSAEAHQQLVDVVQKDPLWTALPRCALGPNNGEAVLRVSEDSVCSSILASTAKFETIVGSSKTVREERVPLRTLESVRANDVPAGARVFLKVDTQGFERQVIGGLGKDLALWPIIQLELSLVPLYEGEESLSSMVVLLESMGYSLYALFPSFWSKPSYQLRQVDCIFVREAEAKPSS